MPVSKKLASLLKKSGIAMDMVNHRVVYTAYDTAQTLRAKLTEVAKPLLLKADKGYALAILSAGHSLDLKKIKKALQAKKVRIPTEKEIVAGLKLKKKEGLASFGSLYGIPVILEKAFAKNTKGIFSTGSFTDSLQLKLKDFIKLESPRIGAFAVAKKFFSGRKKPKVALKKKTVKKSPKKKHKK